VEVQWRSYLIPQLEEIIMNHRKLALGGALLVFFLLAQTVSANISTPQAKLPAAANPVLLVASTGTYASLASNARYVTFESASSDLLPGAISGSWDVYLHDLQTDQVERVDTRTGGAAVYNPGDYTSPPAISSDGRFVTFMSQAENLVGIDHNHMPDIFLHDRTSNTTELISVALTSSSGNADSYTPAVSADGRFVAFQSFASNLVQGDTNNALDVFIRDRKLGVTELVSVTNSGAQGSDPHDYGFPGVSLSDDGRYVAFSYQNLPVAGSPSTGPNIYLRDRQAHTTRWIAPGTLPRLSANGRFLAFVTNEALPTDDKNGGADVYLLDLTSNHFERISVASGVADAPGAEIVDQPGLSSDARFVAFETSASLVPADTNGIADIYLRDRQSGTTTLISTTPGGDPGNGESHFPSISSDGSAVAFTSLSSNLVSNSTSGQNGVFVYHLAAPVTTNDPRVFLPVVTLN
jgi:Tol biopolymer transport system component